MSNMFENLWQFLFQFYFYNSIYFLLCHFWGLIYSIVFLYWIRRILIRLSVCYSLFEKVIYG